MTEAGHDEAMPLVDLTEQAFAIDGNLARRLPDFSPRAGQTQMARAVAETIAAGGELVVEAGTGVGKTFAYLVPALLSRERALISTATKTLQDQLFGRDLPRLARVLGVPVRVALLKGRGSYVCLERLGHARQSVSLTSGSSAVQLARVERWAPLSETGDLAELPDLDEHSTLIPWITSTRENCLGGDCPRARECHVNRARREAMAADLVVINHHLFFADLAVRESGVAELLPTVRLVIFDEAHQLNETGVQFLGLQFATTQILDFTREMLSTAMRLARGQQDWVSWAERLERSVREWRLVVGRFGQRARVKWPGDAPHGCDASTWQAHVRGLLGDLQACAQVVQRSAEAGPEMERLAQRAHDLANSLERFRESVAPDHVRWLDLGPQLRLVESPLDIASAVRHRLLGAGPGGEPIRAADSDQGEDRRRALIFTSATLGDSGGLEWFTESCGLMGARILRVGSPFDYTQQAALYIPARMPAPSDPSHANAVAALAVHVSLVLGGRTMVLTTTTRAMKEIARLVAKDDAIQTAGLRVLVQGQMSKRLLLDAFRTNGDSRLAGAILVATASFWEGVDLPGAVLQAVVIDKLPFPPPTDPLVEARAKRCESRGENPFRHYFLAEAAMALKQGAGRLIRREDDRGVLIVCDVRLDRASYGRRLLAALPPMQRIRDEASFAAYLQTLTKVATRHSDVPESPE